MLGNFEHRMRTTRKSALLIKNKGIKPDYIIGTKSGIAFDASLAQLLGKKLLINHNGEHFAYREELCIENTLENFRKLLVKKDKKGRPESLIITTPFVVPHGIQYTNELGISFAYLRNLKNHGKEKWVVEGIIKPNMKFVFLYSYEEKYEEAFKITERLQKELGIELLASLKVENGYNKVFSHIIEGKTAITIKKRLFFFKSVKVHFFN